jgi:CRISPR-associated protein Csb2
MLELRRSNEQPPRSIFSDRWLVLEHARDEPHKFSSEIPDVRATALLAKALRCVLMSGYRENGQEHVIPAVVSGHAADGSPVIDPHLAIVPLAFLGTQYANERIFGMAFVPPGNSELLDDPDFQHAIRRIAHWVERKGRRELRVTCNGFNSTFTITRESNLRSLDPAPYVSIARTWATCTPIVLDRHLKAVKNADRERELRELILQACRNIGLPPPASSNTRTGQLQHSAAIAAGNHSAIQNAPSAYPSGRAPQWTGWRLPASLATRQLTHAVIQFEKPVRGPVILGAGRFVGLGLCRALDPEDH